MRVKVEVVPSPKIGGIRGVFLHLLDESIVNASFLGPGLAMTQAVFGNANEVINFGGGSNMNSGETPCPCDVGSEIGTPGIGPDDIRTTTFVPSRPTADLSIAHVDSQMHGVRLTSVEPLGTRRNGSSKLSVAVPEPSAGLALPIASLAGSTRRSRH